MRDATAQYSRSVRLDSTRYETSPANATHATLLIAKPVRTDATIASSTHSVPFISRANDRRRCMFAYSVPVMVSTPAAAM